jgi:hypothetical protein
MEQSQSNSRSWQFSRQINLAVLVQLLLLASLIIGSWVNLQRQLALLQHDMSMLIQTHKQLQTKLEQLAAQGTNHEYRLRAVEKAIPEVSKGDGSS